ncbi:DUF86 domain-containing protein [Litorilinea aerophila]|uniref:DUF86 domain-containing protein n=1 Tax=Litorilinea aerophila TaxID=1204385 RepID=A0A540VCD5_9CHLR|nr:HepT-like ribonuclease domain-containing protein [Litorilinea aerophila]MCC9077812.1 DUF86 domain-containing protein [Litorilinea aerophila]OUC06141.1 hypothetical protein RY27_22860 [Litorilinea aerophila]
MQLETKKLLFDIFDAGSAIKRFVKGKSLVDYQQDEMMRAAVERKFEIIGEALRRLQISDEDVLEDIREYRKIIGFRNLLAHGYDAISDEVVWEICQDDLSLLLEDVSRLLDR